MDETVRIEFDPPRQCKEVGKAFRVSGEGVDEMFLPTAMTQLEWEGGKVMAVTIPQWLAVREGLVEDDEPSFLREEDDTMTRDDWFLLGMAMALASAGETANHNIPCEARKLARRLQGDT